MRDAELAESGAPPCRGFVRGRAGRRSAEARFEADLRQGPERRRGPVHIRRGAGGDRKRGEAGRLQDAVLRLVS